MAPSATYNTAWQAGAGEASGSGIFNLERVLESATGDGEGHNWEPHKRQHTLAGDRAYSNLKASLLNLQGPAIFIAGSRGSGKTHLLMSLIGEVCREEAKDVVRIPVIISALKFRSDELTWQLLSPAIADAVVETMRQVEGFGKEHPNAVPQFKTIASLKRPLSELIRTSIDKVGLEETLETLGKLNPKISLILGFDDMDKLDDAKVKKFLIESQNNIQHILNTPSKLVFSVRPQTWTLLESEAHEDTNFLIAKMQGSSQHIVVPTLLSMSAVEIQKLINERIRYIKPNDVGDKRPENGRGGSFDRERPHYSTVEEAVSDLGCWPLHTLNDEGQIYDLRDWLVATYTTPVVRDLLMALEFMLNNDSPPPKSPEGMTSLLQRGLKIEHQDLSRELISRLYKAGYTAETLAREKPFFTGTGLETSIQNPEHLEHLRNYFRGSDEEGDVLLRESKLDRNNLTILESLRKVLKTFDDIPENEFFEQWVLPSGQNYSGFAEDIIARMDEVFFYTFFQVISAEKPPRPTHSSEESVNEQVLRDLQKFSRQTKSKGVPQQQSGVPRETPESLKKSVAEHFWNNAEPSELEAMEAAIQRGDRKQVNDLVKQTRFVLTLWPDNNNKTGDVANTALGTLFQRVATAANLGRAVHWEDQSYREEDLSTMRKILLQHFLSLVLRSPDLIKHFKLEACQTKLGWDKLTDEVDPSIINSIKNLHREKEMTFGIMLNRTQEAVNAMISKGLFGNMARQHLQYILDACRSNDELVSLYHKDMLSKQGKDGLSALQNALDSFTKPYCPYPLGPSSIPGLKWSDTLGKMNTKASWIGQKERPPTFQLLLRIASAEMAGGSIHETLEDGSIVPLIRQSDIKLTISSPTVNHLSAFFEMLHLLHLETNHVGEIDIHLDARMQGYLASFANWEQRGEPIFDEKKGEFVTPGEYVLKKEITKKEITSGVVTIFIGDPKNKFEIRDGKSIQRIK